MYAVSSRFLQRLTESHTPIVEALLFRTDGKVEEIPVAGGSVDVDRGSEARRTFSLTTPDPGIIPRDPAAALSVYGARVHVRRGVEFADGGKETVPLGVFRLDEVDGDVEMGPVTLRGPDLSACVSDDQFTEPYKVSGTAVGAITALIQRSLPEATVINRAVDAIIGPRTFDTEANPWEGAQEIAASIGAEVYADPDGIFVIAELPDLLAVEPVWTVAAGEDGVLISADRGMSSAKVNNGVLARGENTEEDAPPVSWLAVDDDPGSPTYWYGPYGRRPRFHSSSTLTSEAACAQAANLLLRQAKAPNATGDFSALPNPALEPGDVLRVHHSDGVKELHQVASFSVPLDEGGDFPIATISAKEDA